MTEKYTRVAVSVGGLCLLVGWGSICMGVTRLDGGFGNWVEGTGWVALGLVVLILGRYTLHHGRLPDEEGS